MTRFFLVRHGETEWNRIHRIQGSSDIPLNDTGRAQALHVGGVLARHRFDLIVSSPLSRAMETATIIARRMRMPLPLPVQSLVERHYGEAEGCTREDLNRRFPGDTPVPGREPREDVQKRVVRTLHDLAIRHPHADILVVSHGGVIRSVVEHAAPGQYSEPIKNCSVHSFEHSPRGLRLVQFDDPMEVMARRIGTEKFVEQNPDEARERAS
jgi:uncharacterized phosphatase